MFIKAEGEAIQLAIKTVSKLAPPSEGSVVIRLKKKQAHILSHSELNSCTVLVPASVEGDGEFAISLESLREATRGRANVELTYKNTLLYVKSGSYLAELATSDVLDQDEQAKAEEPPIVIGAEQAAWLRTAVQDVSIRATALINAYMPIGLHLTEKGAFIACFDNNRMSFLKEKTIKGDANFVVPIETLQAVLECVGHSEFNLIVTDSFAEIVTETVQARLSLPTIEDNSVSLDTVEGKAKEIVKIAADTIVVDKAKLVAFLDNSKAVALKERGEVKVSVRDGKMRMSVSTNAGKVQASVPVQAGAELQFLVDFEYLDELVRKAGAEVELKVVSDAFVMSKTAKGVTVLVAFNQEEGSD